jgi:hypothetical protein
MPMSTPKLYLLEDRGFRLPLALARKPTNEPQTLNGIPVVACCPCVGQSGQSGRQERGQEPGRQEWKIIYVSM